MPSKEVEKGSELLGTIDSFLDRKRASKKRGPDDPGFLNIIEFIEVFKLLPYGLFPVQRFILKLYYGIPLDDTNKIIKVTDHYGSEVLHSFTEVEYLRYLYNDGRCNIKEQDLKHPRYELVLILGRRGSKSTMSAIIAAYELYKLLRRGIPQKYYGIPDGNEIRILCLANDKEQAAITFGDMSSYVDQTDYFKSAIVANTQSFMKFATDADRKKNEGRGRNSKKSSSITATFKASNAKGIRGRGVICGILDELAFFVDDGKTSAEKVYKALTPSIAQFSPKDPKNRHRPIGQSEGRMISISSPDAKEGFFYRLYQLSLSNSKASSNMLMIQAPTWEVNPTVSREYYEVEYAKDPRAFWTEHGAQFSDRVRGWIEDEKDLLECVIDGFRPILAGRPKELFWCGIDFGLVNDGSAIALTRLNESRVEVAYHEVWYAGVPWKEANPHLSSPMVREAYKLADTRRIDVDDIIEWIYALSRKFFIVKGLFDQWAGPIFEQKLHKRGLTQFEMRKFAPAEASAAYQTTKMLMYTRQLGLYNHPSRVDENNIQIHSPFIKEFLELQASSGGKNITVVEAPNVPGKHDDVPDAVVRSVLLASEYIKDHPDVLDRGSFAVAPQRTGNNYNQFYRIRRQLHGPPPRERTIPKMLRRR